VRVAGKLEVAIAEVEKSEEYSIRVGSWVLVPSQAGEESLIVNLAELHPPIGNAHSPNL